MQELMLAAKIAVSVNRKPAASVLIFEVRLNATSMFNHSNVRMPLGFDRVLPWLVVTPDMHRVHHSMHLRETNSNFGFNLPWWDRLMGTYHDQPAEGHTEMAFARGPKNELAIYQQLAFQDDIDDFKDHDVPGREEAFAKALQDSQAEVRLQAVLALHEYGRHNREIAPVLLKSLGTKSEENHWEIRELIQAVGPRVLPAETLAPLIAQLKRTTDERD